MNRLPLAVHVTIRKDSYPTCLSAPHFFITFSKPHYIPVCNNTSLNNHEFNECYLLNLRCKTPHFYLCRSSTSLQTNNPYLYCIIKAEHPNNGTAQPGNNMLHQTMQKRQNSFLEGFLAVKNHQHILLRIKIY